jgi:hypothetical protein
MPLQHSDRAGGKQSPAPSVAGAIRIAVRRAVGDRSRQLDERAEHASGMVIVPRAMGPIRRRRPAETRDDSHADGSKGSKRSPSLLYGSLTACWRRSRSTPIASTWLRSLGKLGTTRWRRDKPAGRAAVLGSLLIALLAMPQFSCRPCNGSCLRYRWGCFRSPNPATQDDWRLKIV